MERRIVLLGFIITNPNVFANTDFCVSFVLIIIRKVSLKHTKQERHACDNYVHVHVLY